MHTVSYELIVYGIRRTKCNNMCAVCVECVYTCVLVCIPLVTGVGSCPGSRICGKQSIFFSKKKKQGLSKSPLTSDCYNA